MLRLLALSLFMFAASAFAAERPDILEIMPIDGIIDEGMAAKVKQQVEEINDNPRIKAVLLMVNSPGGGVLASSDIYEELTKLKVPVVGWCNDICASGGMYVLMAPTVKYIGVRSTTISGSIGVIMDVMKYDRLLNWAKVDVTIFRSGKFKQAGNPNIPMSDEERAHLQGTIDTLAGRFYSLVAKARPKITDAQWDDIKTAKIYFGSDGIKAGLVDQVMTYDEAVKKAKDLSGSKLIYTRDEVKKMSKLGERDAAFEAAPKEPLSRLDMLADQTLTILRGATHFAEEVHTGQSIRIEYRFPIILQ